MRDTIRVLPLGPQPQKAMCFITLADAYLANKLKAFNELYKQSSQAHIILILGPNI